VIVVSSLDESGVHRDVEGEPTVHLVREFEDDRRERQVLEGVRAEVFEPELRGWHTPETRWPKNRTLATFRQAVNSNLELA
jgi:hypothetical protein